MNIFYLSESPVQSSQWMVDKHVVKMILESAQLLSTAHRILDGEKKVILTDKNRKKTIWLLGDGREDVLYTATHVNHPSAVWCRESVENYNWLYEHMFALGKEYTYRYDKVHKVFRTNLGYMLSSPPLNLKNYKMTKIPSAMKDDFKISDDPILNYRHYYNTDKKPLHRWKNRAAPYWITP